MNIPHFLRLFCIPLVAASVFASGCSSSKKQTGIVRGKVSYGSKHVAGTVKFVAEDGTSAEGIIYTDGTYEVPNAPVGKCKVAIITEHLRPKKQTGMPTVPGTVGGQGKPPTGGEAGRTGPPKGAEAAGGTGKVPNAKYEPIPARYEDPNTSTLTFDVQTGEQTYDITLK